MLLLLCAQHAHTSHTHTITAVEEKQIASDVRKLCAALKITLLLTATTDELVRDGYHGATPKLELNTANNNNNHNINNHNNNNHNNNNNNNNHNNNSNNHNNNNNNNTTTTDFDELDEEMYDVFDQLTSKGKDFFHTVVKFYEGVFFTQKYEQCIYLSIYFYYLL